MAWCQRSPAWALSSSRAVRLALESPITGKRSASRASPDTVSDHGGSRRPARARAATAAGAGPGGVGHEPGRLQVQDIAGNVRPDTVDDTLLLAGDVPLPQRQQLLDPGRVERRGQFAQSGPEAGGFVDEGAEDVDHDGIDLRLCHGWGLLGAAGA